jgi:hypothetical protein
MNIDTRPRWQRRRLSPRGWKLVELVAIFLALAAAFGLIWRAL